MGKFSYYLEQIITNPRLIISSIFKTHLGLILELPIMALQLENKDFKIMKATNVKEIEKFYRAMNRKSMTEDKIRNWLNKANDCFLIYNSLNIPIGGLWIQKDKILLSTTSEKTLSSHKFIELNEDTIYACYIIIDQKYRGNNLSKDLLKYVMRYYLKYTNFKNIILITGGSNAPMITITQELGGMIIGISRVVNFIGLKIRNEIFLNNKLKKWKDAV